MGYFYNHMPLNIEAGLEVQDYLRLQDWPEYKPGMTPLELMIKDFRSMVLFTNTGLHLISLELLSPTYLADVLRFKTAWNDKELRKWYMETTPTTIEGIKGVHKNWDMDPNTLVLLYSEEIILGKTGFLHFEFSPLEEGCSAWLSYGNLVKEKMGKGITRRSAGASIYWLTRETKKYGMPMNKIITTVNQFNLPSRKILDSIGFELDSSRKPEISTDYYGGYDLPMILNLL